MKDVNEISESREKTSDSLIATGFTRCEITDESTSLIKKDENTYVKDRYNLVFIIFVIQGLATILPWNLFLTAKSYYVDYKLYPAGDADYRLNFLTYAGVASQIPNTVLNGLNLFSQGQSRLNVSHRIIISNIITLLLFVLTIAMCLIDSSQWPGVFFAITLITIIIFNMCSGVWANCIFGIGAQFPTKYINGIITGMNISGLLCALMVIGTKEAGDSDRTSALFYFIIAMVILILALDAFLSFKQTRYFRMVYSDAKISKDNRIQTYDRLPYFITFKKIWVELFDVWLHRLVSLTVYPAIMVDVKRLDPNFFIPEHLFADINCYLLTGITRILGSICSYYVRGPSSKYMIFVQAGRCFLIPFFVMCNYRPATRGSLPVIFNDWVFMIGCIIHGFINGQMSGTTMMNAKKAAGDDKMMQKTAGMMAAFLQSFGFMCGHWFTLLVTYLVENIY
ncbi:equilibrative nucleoside transporter 3-like [Tubulanus polymorphus]|uniref:equilibrative nucleoside transporter 3-like n=1 Tax=Tubulanus polymorphus TaxID=672921 RepID=UPI003DA68110